ADVPLLFWPTRTCSRSGVNVPTTVRGSVPTVTVQGSWPLQSGSLQPAKTRPDGVSVTLVPGSYRRVQLLSPDDWSQTASAGVPVSALIPGGLAMIGVPCSRGALWAV